MCRKQPHDSFLTLCQHRSPWSNTYDPPLDDGTMPSERLRRLEVEANGAFDQYREMYFEGGVSSVYLWDLDHGFAGVILIKKAGDGSKKIKGCWDSIHVVEVQVTFEFLKSYSLLPLDERKKSLKASCTCRDDVKFLSYVKVFWFSDVFYCRVRTVFEGL